MKVRAARRSVLGLVDGILEDHLERSGLEQALLFVGDADDAARVSNDDPASYLVECDGLASTLNREVCQLWQIQLGEFAPAVCDRFTEVPMNFCQPYTQ